MAIEYIIGLIIVIMSVSVHEMAHGFIALYWGDETAKNQGRLTLNPLKHLDFFGSIIFPIITFLLNVGILGWAKPVMYNPANFRDRRWGELTVALAGPVSNLIIAIFFAIIFRLGSSSLSFGFLSFSFSVVMINVTLAVFNLIPIPPLDGSKILFNLVPSISARLRGVLESYSIILVLLLIMFLWPVFTPIVKVLTFLLTGVA